MYCYISTTSWIGKIFFSGEYTGGTPSFPDSFLYNEVFFAATTKLDYNKCKSVCQSLKLASC